ncbi:M4 family metallopeptidase [Streptomyces fenghuangensis]
MTLRRLPLSLLGRCAATAAFPALLLAAVLSTAVVWFSDAAPGASARLAVLFLDSRADAPLLAFGAATGVPVEWDVGAGAVTGEASLPVLVDRVPWLALAFLVPALPGVLLARAVVRQSRRVGLPRRVLLPAALVGYGLQLAAAATVSAALAPESGLVGLRVDVPSAVLLGTAWAAAAAVPALGLRWTGGPLHRAVPTRRGAAVMSGVLLAAVLAPSAAALPARGAEAPADDSAAAAGADPAAARAVARLRGPENGRAVTAWNPKTGTPSSVLLESPFPGDGRAWLRAHRALISTGDDPTAFLRPDRERGAASANRAAGPGVTETSLWYEQVVNGVPVHQGRVGIHLDPSGTEVWSVTNGFRPGLEDAPTEPAIDAGAAVAEARRALPGGRLVEEPRLYLRPGATPADDGSQLVWRVWLMDDAHQVSNEYFVDARTGRGILDVEDRHRYGLDRRVYDYVHSEDETLPAAPSRTEGTQLSGVRDVNQAYDYTGATYRYYKDTLGRDSYDGAGASLVSGVRYGHEFRNAYWDGEKMVFGEGMAVLDIAAHELTHAVTEHTAGLEYRDQPGALNESYSDIFGEMVERSWRGSNDWLMGDGSPVGVIRSMKDPEKYDQPAHMRDYETPCYDNGGVHINSGIPNHAFYRADYSLLNGQADRIFYLALTDYLFERSTFADARNATVAAAWRLYGKESQVGDLVATAWSGVGVESDTPPSDSSESCTCVSGTRLPTIDYPEDGPDEADVRATLYRARDLLPEISPAAAYYVQLYNEDSPLLNPILEENDALATEFGEVMLRLQPLIEYANGNGQGEAPLVTQGDIEAVDHLLDGISRADLARENGGALAESIEVRWRAPEYETTAGLPADQALDLLNQQVEQIPGW